MKTVKQLLVIAALVAAPLATGGIVLADEGTISDTGPGSDNEVITETDYKCEVVNENEITITNLNDGQIVYSGPVDVDDNTDAGDATSGSATNSNDTSFDVSITNDGCIASVVEVTPEPEEPVTPTEKVTPTEEAEPVVLAKTAGSDTIQLLIVLGAASLTVAAGTLAVTRYAKR